MRQIKTIHRDELNTDGKVVRKYELSEVTQKSPGVLLAISFIAVNFILLLKDFIFSNDADNKLNAENSSELKQATFVLNDNHEPFNQLELQENSQDQELNAPELQSSGSSFRFFQNQGKSLFESPGEVTSNPYVYEAKLNTGSHRFETNQEEDNIIPFPGNAGAAPRSLRKSEGGEGEGDRGRRSQNRDVGEEADGTAEEDKPIEKNRLPVVLAPVVLADLYVNQSIIIKQSAFLENVFDPDGDELTVSSVKASSGVIVETMPGEWLYTPSPYDLTEVIFTYRISDFEESVIQTASLTYNPLEGQEIIGTSRADRLVGTPGGDIIAGLAGDDLILSREDNDVIHAGDGNDRIVAGQGDDIIYAGKGDDVVFAGSGDDYVSGGEGDDIIFGEEGDDTLEGDEGSDEIFGGRGNDRILGGQDNDKLRGEKGEDFIVGDEGDDEIDGGDDDDIIIAGKGNDEVKGGEGNDTFIAEEDDGDDTYLGGQGLDTIDYTTILENLEINLKEQKIVSASTGTDIIESIENVVGGQGDDRFIADEAVNIFTGNDGQDVFVFETSNRGSGNQQDQSKIRDKILDFETGDKIDISKMDRFLNEDGLQKLVFKYDQASFDAGGQVIYQYEEKETGTNTILKFKFDVDEPEDLETSDYEIVLVGRHEFDGENLYI